MKLVAVKSLKSLPIRSIVCFALAGQIIREVSVLIHCPIQSFLLVIFHTHHKERIIFNFLFHQLVVFSIVFQFAICSLIAFVMNGIGQGNRNGQTTTSSEE